MANISGQLTSQLRSKKRTSDPLCNLKTKRIKLDPVEIASSTTDSSPIAPAFSPNLRTVYAQARSALRLSSESASLHPLLGRDDQRASINKFLASRLDKSTHCPGAMYIAGRPGTGKTMLVNELSATQIAFQSLYINCASLAKASDLVSNTLSVMDANESTLTDELVAGLEREFLLVLDEIDHLTDHSILIELFRLANVGQSKLTVIGIANALDLSSNVFAHVDNTHLAQCNFAPYSADEMVCIAVGRLRLLQDPLADLTNLDKKGVPFFADNAVQLAAKKVAASTGDLRTLLAVLRKAVELAEAKVDQEHRINHTVANAVKASPKEILAAFQAVQTSPTASSTMTVASHLQNASANQIHGISAKLNGLGLAAKVCLVGICVCLDRALSTSKSTKDTLLLEEAWLVYQSILSNASKKELEQTRTDWESLIDNLVSVGLVDNERSKPPTPQAKRRSPKKSKERTIKLCQPLLSVLEALRSHVSAGKAEGTKMLCTIMDEETRRKGRRAKVWETQIAAPSTGFSGNGLGDRENMMLGKALKGRSTDEDVV